MQTGFSSSFPLRRLVCVVFAPLPWPVERPFALSQKGKSAGPRVPPKIPSRKRRSSVPHPSRIRPDGGERKGKGLERLEGRSRDGGAPKSFKDFGPISVQEIGGGAGEEVSQRTAARLQNMMSWPPFSAT
jgi:hypothetical protein